MKPRALGKERGNMKEWAEWFYKSKEWAQTRDAYMVAQHYLCERCGEPAKIVHHKIWLTPKNIHEQSITLCWDNLEALCQDCHNKEHHAKNVRAKRYAFTAIFLTCSSFAINVAMDNADHLFSLRFIYTIGAAIIAIVASYCIFPTNNEAELKNMMRRLLDMDDFLLDTLL